MKLAIITGAAALALGACTQSAGDNNVAATESNDTFGEATGSDPATTDLTLNSDASTTDQAINQTQEQSELDDAAASAANGADNSTH